MLIKCRWICAVGIFLYCTVYSQSLSQVLAKAENYAANQLIDGQYWEGYFYSDSSFTSHYLILHDYLELENNDTVNKMLAYLINEQNEEGSWSLYHEAAQGDLGLTTLNYLALTLFYGESKDNSDAYLEQSLLRASRYIQAKGGLDAANSISKIFYALYGVFPWEKQVDFPLIFFSQKPFIKNKFPIKMDELNWLKTAVAAYALLKHYEPQKKLLPNQLQWIEKIIPTHGFSKINHGIDALDEKLNSSWVEGFLSLDQQLNEKKYIHNIENILIQSIEQDGSVSLASPVAVLFALALQTEDPVKHENLIDRIVYGLQEKQKIFLKPYIGAFQQFSRSSIWDTGFFLKAMNFSDEEAAPIVRWLLQKKQYRFDKSHNMTVGWAFEPFNTHNLDNDTSAVVVSALLNYSKANPQIRQSVEEGVRFLLKNQNQDGGWGAFDKDLNSSLIKEHAFSDTVLLTDPSTPDITCHILETLAAVGYTHQHKVVQDALNYLTTAQVKVAVNKSVYKVWRGSWGLNYLYATSACLLAFEAIALNEKDDRILQAKQFIQITQNKDGGWGETPKSDLDPIFAAVGQSRPTTTAYALLGLLAFPDEEKFKTSIAKGFTWLKKHQVQGTWNENMFICNATNFAKLNYCHYEYYPHYFPMLALKKALNMGYQ